LTSLADDAAIARVGRVLQADLDFLGAATRDPGRATGMYARVLQALGFAPDELELRDGVVDVRSVAGPAELISAYGVELAGVEPGEYPPRSPPGRAPTWRAFAQPSDLRAPAARGQQRAATR